jgi:hypothetical protein
MAEKIQNNLSNDQKKSSDEQFLQAPRNWQKCSALGAGEKLEDFETQFRIKWY